MHDSVRNYISIVRRVRARLDESQGVGDANTKAILGRIEESLRDERYEQAFKIYQDELVVRAPEIAGDLGPPPPKPRR